MYSFLSFEKVDIPWANKTHLPLGFRGSVVVQSLDLQSRG